MNKPWMSAAEYGRQLTGLGINLLVADIGQSIRFQTIVLQAKLLYSDQDFAAFSGYGAQWMLHADHTYLHHPLSGMVRDIEGRGAGVELRIYDCNPDAASDRAKENDFIVLQSPMDKPHGLREAYILDPDGYVWVPSHRLSKSDMRQG